MFRVKAECMKEAATEAASFAYPIGLRGVLILINLA
jgi:hypothetical protein